MWKNSKVRICILILLFTPSKLLFAESLNQNSNFITTKNYYNLMVPEKINISIIGKEYIKYLKQIRDVGEKQNLNSSVINFHKKKWIDAKIKSEILDDNQINIEIILHGDFNDHISLPYSSLRAKVKSKFFYQLKNFILFKPKTRRHEAEIFGILFFKNIGILSPFSRYIKLTINDNLPEDYIFQEKITKYLIERKMISKKIVPILSTEYVRSYYFSEIYGRITIDQNLEYQMAKWQKIYKSFNFIGKKKDKRIIIEHKTQNNSSTNNFVTLASSRFSKYCEGVKMLNLNKII